ncbi:unnamed protein product [Lathyrus oleraceus]
MKKKSRLTTATASRSTFLGGGRKTDLKSCPSPSYVDISSMLFTVRSPDPRILNQITLTKVRRSRGFSIVLYQVETWKHEATLKSYDKLEQLSGSALTRWLDADTPQGYCA